MTFVKYIKTAERFVQDNSPLLLTTIGVGGVITTAYLTGRATFRAADILAREEVLRTKPIDEIPFERKDKFKLVWTLYIPAIATGTVTCAAVIGANRVGTRRAAAMAAAYSISEKAFSEYKDKVVEKIGSSKEQKIRDEVVQDAVNKNPVGNQEIILAGSSKVLCYDRMTDRYFPSSMEELKKAQNDLNYQLLNDAYASLSDFYNYVGLNSTSYSDELGWTSENKLELMFTSILSEDSRPCLAIDFVVRPIRNYWKTNG